MKYDVESIRGQFPALKRTVNGFPAAYLDGPGGTQVPQRVIDKMVDYLIHHNANIHGDFATSIENDAMILETRKVFADYFGCSWDEVAFCHNSTTISFKLAQGLARDLKPGDEILLTDMDHEANRGPWEILSERGLVVRSVRVNPQTCTLDMEDYRAKLTGKTKVVAFNYASNAVGTISDAKAIIRLAKEAGATTIVDAVHYALHGVIDVKDLGTDFLFCSAYKFFGPHIGVLYGKKEALESVKTLRVGAQDSHAPFKFETGTLNHEGIAGAAEAVRFIADVGAQYPKLFPPDSRPCTARRRNIVCGMLALEAYEKPLADYLKKALEAIEGLTLYGPPPGHPCTSTLSFTLRDRHSNEVAKLLGKRGIFVWDGSFYAIQLVKSLGLHESGGLVRIGLAPYNTKEEIDRTIAEIQKIAAGQDA